MSANKRIGDALTSAMTAQGLNPQRLSDRTGKGVRHIQAVLDGYPNSRRTMLDTVDEIAEALGLQLDVTARNNPQ